MMLISPMRVRCFGSCTATPSSRPPRWRARRLRPFCVAQQAQQGEEPLARSVKEMVAQAAAAAKRAGADGRMRHVLELINPVNEKDTQGFMSIDPVDYPTSTMNEFRTILGVAKDVLAGVLGPDVPLTTRRIDEGGIDGDLCAIVEAGGKRAAAVVWPTAERLKQIKELAQDSKLHQLFIINPLWKTEGNLVSELGVGPWRKANEDFLATFEPSFWLVEQRIGAPSSINMATNSRYGSGAVVRVCRTYPGDYLVHVLSYDGASQCIGAFPTKPTYKELDGLISKARQAGKEIFQVARRASARELNPNVVFSGNSSPGTGAAAAGGAGAEQQEWYSREEVQEMEPKVLRRALLALGLPSAGTPDKLRARALAVADGAAGGGGLEVGLAAARKLR